MKLLPYLATIFVNIFFYININKISKKINIFDIPDNKRKIHKKPIPPIGGLIIFISLSLFLLFSFFFNFEILFEDFFYINNLVDVKSIVSFYFSLILLLVLGLFDDKYGVKANYRLIFFTIIFYLAVLLDDQLILSSIKLNTLNFELNLDKLKYFFTILCFLVLINSFNMFDGINLQSGTFLLFVFSVFIYKGIFFEISMCIFISLIFFIFYNYKNNVFLGNHGIYILSFIISFIILKNYNSSGQISPEEVFLLFYMPILELLRLFFLRIYKNKNPFKGDLNHIHHIIINKNNDIITANMLIFLLSFTPFIIFQLYESFYIIVLSILLYIAAIFTFKKVKK